MLPVLTAVRARRPVPISIDTTKAAVAAAALDAGADVVNDVSRPAASIAGMLPLVRARAACRSSSMHMRGTPGDHAARGRATATSSREVRGVPRAARGRGARRRASPRDAHRGRSRASASARRVAHNLALLRPPRRCCVAPRLSGRWWACRARASSATLLRRRRPPTRARLGTRGRGGARRRARRARRARARRRRDARRASPSPTARARSA